MAIVVVPSLVWFMCWSFSSYLSWNCFSSYQNKCKALLSIVIVHHGCQAFALCNVLVFLNSVIVNTKFCVENFVNTIEL